MHSTCTARSVDGRLDESCQIVCHMHRTIHATSPSAALGVPGHPCNRLFITIRASNLRAPGVRRYSHDPINLLDDIESYTSMITDPSSHHSSQPSVSCCQRPCSGRRLASSSSDLPGRILLTSTLWAKFKQFYLLHECLCSTTNASSSALLFHAGKEGSRVSVPLVAP